VLDEADEMLNMGFRDDIEFILEYSGPRSTWLLVLPCLRSKAGISVMKDPSSLLLERRMPGVIFDQYYVTNHNNRYETLKRIIDFNPGIYGIIFTRTKADAQSIAETIIREGYDIEALHGDLTQQQRDKVMGRFREKSLQLLIATDVAARGIDVTGITHVINYELPDDRKCTTEAEEQAGQEEVVFVYYRNTT
jgi:ATP-dependent RNA helicase DeaD